MKAGDRRHRVTLQRRTATPHGKLSAWETVDTYWAQVTPLRGTERVAIQEQVQGEADYEVRMLANVGTVSIKDRFLYNSKVLNIVDITDVDERHVELIITCKEVKHA